MRFVFTPSLLLGLLTLPAVARADGLTSYSIHGSLQSGGSASGTLSVSPSGSIVGVSITVTDLGSTYQFGGIQATSANPNLFEAFSDSKTNSQPDYLFFYFPQSSLTGYTGGSLCSLSYSCPDSKLPATGDLSNLQLNIGYPDDPNFKSVTDDFTALTASVPNVPEPSTFVLVGTGLVGFLGAVRRRCGQ